MLELSAHSQYSEKFYELSYWRLTSGIEVDFIVNDMELAIEAKATPKVTSDHLKGLRHLAQDHPRVRKRVVVCREPKERVSEDKILILPVKKFIERLWDGSLFKALS